MTLFFSSGSIDNVLIFFFDYALLNGRCYVGISKGTRDIRDAHSLSAIRFAVLCGCSRSCTVSIILVIFVISVLSKSVQTARMCYREYSIKVVRDVDENLAARHATTFSQENPIASHSAPLPYSPCDVLLYMWYEPFVATSTHDSL